MDNFKFEKIKSKYSIHYLATDKFKTNLIQIYFMLPLTSWSEAAMNALIPAVLIRGSNRFPESRIIKTELKKLYGAGISFSVLKRGENQLLRFSLEYVNENYLDENINLSRKSFELLSDLIFNPLLEEKKFVEKYYLQEKKNQIENINSLINDKYNYAVEKCFQNMCKDEKYGIYKLGDVKSLKENSCEELYNQYKKIKSSARSSVFMVGDFKKSFISNVFDEIKLPSTDDIIDNFTDKTVPEREVQYITEEMSVNQAKLTAGFRTGITRDMEEYYALLVVNSLLGGFSQSKLFQEVREKRSLAYYINSFIESTKGLMMVSSGINPDNYVEVLKLIKEQIAAVVAGDFTDREFQWAKKSIINRLKQDLDSSKSLAAHYLLSVINDKPESIISEINNIKKVGRNDIMSTAEKIKLDTVYFLRSEE
ncbi:EF-P 5-aminopentanol modification-associated protein YfmF [Halanaerobium sp. MA284_MarDTE_T2]|uniref:EF-P 5-aminopentanol modification-associated protein YfmF n=1 Tax=Halanaerobium sp. MA284_MarDTE_T2 TaxID=2183913 RepID=UPI000DF3058A|nr:pitrilysin family protein [Halanaerobium sp. MA284_MarDTE_T2]RCW51468.1 putative Zn-dependent peptidase [Halanaerobium sp. MA284_MarDTE_T2]